MRFIFNFSFCLNGIFFPEFDRIAIIGRKDCKQVKKEVFFEVVDAVNDRKCQSLPSPSNNLNYCGASGFYFGGILYSCGGYTGSKSKTITETFSPFKTYRPRYSYEYLYCSIFIKINPSPLVILRYNTYTRSYIYC